MPETLKVEYEELMARANEIEAALPPIPATNPAGPCALSFVTDAATQLALSADSMRLYLRACEREWKALAKSLRNAAKAYEEVDECRKRRFLRVGGHARLRKRKRPDGGQWRPVRGLRRLPAAASAAPAVVGVPLLRGQGGGDGHRVR
ncbi:hypothetical protein H7I93_11890 [Mycobacterium nebraskense]|nr:hypothetical protein [Mycobacterium nebraskense]